MGAIQGIGVLCNEHVWAMVDILSVNTCPYACVVFGDIILSKSFYDGVEGSSAQGAGALRLAPRVNALEAEHMAL